MPGQPSLGVSPPGDLVAVDVVLHQEHRQSQGQPWDLDKVEALEFRKKVRAIVNADLTSVQ